jgi:Spy/CpxP family protein refolding chaperone
LQSHKEEIEMKKYGLFALTVLLAAGLAVQVLAAPPKPLPASLTPAQAAKMKADQDARRATMTAQRDKMKGLTDQLRAELKKKPVDRNKVNALIKQIDLQQATMQVQQMQMMMDQSSNLRPEQKKRYSDMIQKAKSRLAKRQAEK